MSIKSRSASALTGAWLMLVALSATYGATMSVDRLDIDDGLAQSTVLAIAQDPTGFIWMGTQDGLHRYDGIRFRIFRPDDKNPDQSLPTNSIRTLIVDSEGTLWVASFVGLSRYDDAQDNFKNYLHDIDDPESISTSDALTILEDSSGSLWVGTNGGGINLFDRQNETFRHFRYSPLAPKSDFLSPSVEGDWCPLTNVVRALYQDSLGQIWVGTDRGLYRFFPESGRLVLFKSPVAVTEDIGYSVVTTVHETEDGKLLVGTKHRGLFVISRDRGQTTHYTATPDNPASLANNDVSTVYQDSSGRIWIGTYGGGLHHFLPESGAFLRYRAAQDNPTGLSDNRILSVFEDRSGVVWFGTYAGGVNRLNPYGFSLTLKRHKRLSDGDPSQNDVRAFLVDSNGSLWVGTEGGGLRRSDPDGTQVNFFHDPKERNSLSNNDVFALAEDVLGNLWVGTENGWLNRFRPETEDFDRLPVQGRKDGGPRHGKVRSLIAAPNGELWAGVEGGGLHRVIPTSGTVEHFHHKPGDSNSLSSDRVFSLTRDRSGILWVATFGGGLNRFDSATNKFTAFRTDPQNPEGLSSDHILSVHQDKKRDVLWVSTLGYGIDEFDPATGRTIHHDETRGLPNNTVYGLLQDRHGHLWASHNKGLSRYDPGTQTFKNYDVGDGLQSNEFNGGAFYESPTGQFYFGGINGYNAFVPQDIADNPHPPQVALTGLTLFNEQVAVGAHIDDRILIDKTLNRMESLILSHRDSVFSLEFAALDFVLPEMNQYAYRMEGLEERWNYVGNRHFATYTTLPPGNYNFRVKAANNHGVWNETGIAMPVVITPPYWQTWWFRLIWVLLVASLVFLIFAIRVNRIRAQNQKLEGLVRDRTAELEHRKTHLEETVHELNETKDALIEAAHRAGMAETATGVLHNVGNILNSVGVSASLIQDVVENPIGNRIKKVNGLLAQHAENLPEFLDSEKGKNLFKYLAALDEPLETENRLLADSVRRLHEKISAIKEAISTQQSMAKGRHRYVEKLSLTQLVEDTLDMQALFLERHRIDVVTELEFTEPLDIQKTKVVQILTNLFKNAAESMEEADADSRVLGIRVSQNEESVCICVEDSGVGIDADRLDAIFAYGHSSKSNGHGFGLHSSANYMAEHQGSIRAVSPGLGQGATFILRFPRPASTAVFKDEPEALTA